MEAEGGTHILTGTLIQGMGLVLEYRCLDEKRLARGVSTEMTAIRQKPDTNLTPSQWSSLDKAKTRAFGRASSHSSDEESQRSDNTDEDPQYEIDRKGQTLTLWVKAMDKFVFGLIPADSGLGFELQDFPFAEEADCIQVLDTLSNGTIREGIENLANVRWPFNDLIYMVPPVLRFHHGDRTALPFRGMAECASIFSFDSSLVAFGVLLRAHLNGGTKIYDSEVSQVKELYPDLSEEELDSKMLGKMGLVRGRTDGGTEQMKKILSRADNLAANCEIKAGPEATRLIEELHDDHASTTQYFSERTDEIRFYDLLEAHFSKTTLASSKAQATKKKFKFTHYNWDPSSSTMETYFSFIPDYVDFMRKKHRDTHGARGCANEDLVTEAWFTMMWRGFLFRFLHTYDFEWEGIYVPSEYCGSRLPVSLV